MQQSRRKSAYYKRILKTILVAFLIPAFLATGFLCYFQARQEIRQAYQHQELSQGRLMNVLSGQLFTGVQMAFHCANDSYIVSLSKTPWNVLAFMDLDDKLRSLKATNAYVSDILVWYDHCPMIYSTDGIYPVAPSATSMRFNGGTIEEYMSDSALHFTFQRISIQRAGQIREEICYLYRDQIHPEISVLVALDARMLGFGDAEGMHGESWVALSKNKGERVLSFGLTDEQISGVLARTDIGDAERTVTLDGERFFALMSSEDDYGLRYLTLTPAASTLPSILFSSLAVLGIGLLLVLCGTRVIFYAADRAYEPVEKLYRSVGGQEDVEKDEFHVIDTVLSDLRSTVNDQKQVLESQIPAVKMQLISRLINGQYSSAEDFNYAAETLGIALTHNYYLTAIVAHGETGVQEDVVLVAERFSDGKQQLFGCQMLRPGQYILLLCTSDADDAQRFLSGLHAVLQERIGPTLSMYVSSCCSEFSHIGQTVIECRSLSESSGLNGRMNLFHRDQRDAEQLLRINSQLQPSIRRLHQAICEGSVEDADQCLSLLEKQRKPWELSSFVAQCVHFEIINCVVSALSELTNQQEEVEIDSFDLSGFSTLAETHNTERLIASLKQLIKDFLNRRSDAPKNTREDFDEILSYIESHYTEYDFSVKQVAEYANMSLSKFSQYFRARMDMTVIDYVLKLRIGAARDMLAHTDMLISEIVFSIGYVSVPSFVNKFKRVTGMTPGEYRDQARASQTEGEKRA